MKVDVVIDNRSAIVSADHETMDALNTYWSYFFPSARFTPSYKTFIKSRQAIKMKQATGELPANEYFKPAGWDGLIHLMKNGVVPAGLFRATCVDAEAKLGVKFSIKREWPVVSFDKGFDAGDEKYQYQNECVAAMRKVLPRGGGIVLACTSAGKTRITASFFSKIPTMVRLFVVDQVNLLYQAQQELETWLGKGTVGIVGDSEFLPDIVTVATIQTLHKHSDKTAFKKWFETVDVVVVDELHEQLAKRNFSVMDQLNPMAIYGLTATLQLSKKDVRYRAWAFTGPVIFRFPVEEGMESGVLNKGQVLQLLFEPVDAVGEDAQEDYKIQVTENPVKHRAAKLITHYLINQDRYVMQLVSRLAHLDVLHKMQSKESHALAFGAVKKMQREQNLKDFETGEIKLLIGNTVVKKGVNIKRVDAAIDMAEMKSKNDCMQKFGRLLRLHSEKRISLYIDFGTQKDVQIKEVEGEIERVLVSGRYSKAATSRKRAFTAAGIEVKVVKVNSATEAVTAVVTALAKMGG